MASFLARYLNHRGVGTVVLLTSLFVVVDTVSRLSPESPGPDAGPISSISGTVLVGMACPTPLAAATQCGREPLPRAVVTVSYPGQGEVARSSTSPDGTYFIEIHGLGSFMVSALPVKGLVAPAPVSVYLQPLGGHATVNFEYLRAPH